MEMSRMLYDELKSNLKNMGHKLLGKASLIKPVIDKLKIASIIEEEIMEGYVNNEMAQKPIIHKNVPYGKASEILILNRLVAPKPMYEVEDWVDNKTCIGDLYGIKEGSMNDDLIASVLDTVHPHINNAWNKIISNAASEFKIPFGTLFNDITSTYFEGIYEESDIVKYGYSRDQKPDKKQINIDINANSVGIPLSYKILDGNTADKSTVIGNMEDLINVLKETPLRKIRPIVVGDRAMLNDKIVVAYHERDDMDYLGTLQLTKAMKKKISEISEDDYKIIATDRDYGLYSGYMTTWKFTNEGKSYEDRILIVKSEQKALNDKKSREKQIRKAKEKVDDLKKKLNKTIYKKIDKVENRIENIGKEEKGSKYLKIEVQLNAANEIELNYNIDEEKIKEDTFLDGKYIIATNRMNLSAKEMLKIYKKRDISEKDFEILKDTLNLRPIFLHKDNRIETLVFFIMCALLIYNVIKLILKEAEIETSVNKTLNIFETVIVGYYTFVDDSVAKIVGDLDEKQSGIFGKLNLGDFTQYVKFNP